jgi:hypothetical protein
MREIAKKSEKREGIYRKYRVLRGLFFTHGLRPQGCNLPAGLEEVQFTASLSEVEIAAVASFP